MYYTHLCSSTYKHIHYEVGRKCYMGRGIREGRRESNGANGDYKKMKECKESNRNKVL